MHILLIDNYDSFTYNLYQLLSKSALLIAGEESTSLGNSLKQAATDIASPNFSVKVRYNDSVSQHDLDQAVALVISPGPGRPADAGACIEIIQQQAEHMPILGICLGHQCIAEAFGASVTHAQRLMHGKSSDILHDGQSIYSGLPIPLEVGRYHSLAVVEEDIPAAFEISSYTREGEVMGIRHRELPIEGVQFHPESILTERGPDMIQRFLERVATYEAATRRI